ncbi:MAG: hypothetical protein PHQ98_04930 [Candidatus ainarchaeum sp.]|nr:hypothetical protein [Candidatus ainarchaeum sp.]
MIEEMRILNINIAEKLEGIIYSNKNTNTSLFDCIKHYINIFTEFDQSVAYRTKDKNFDKSIILFDFKGLYDIESKNKVDVKKIVEVLFKNLVEYYGYFYAIKMFRFEPNYYNISSDQHWILRDTAENTIIKNVINTYKGFEGFEVSTIEEKEDNKQLTINFNINVNDLTK